MNIEELAFKNWYELITIQKIDLLLIIEFLQKDRKQWINQFTQTHNESIDIQKENKELKKELKPNYYVKGLEGTLKEYQQEMNKVTTQQKEFIKWLEDEIYTIEPKGTSINFNCEYDSEEDYLRGIRRETRLNTLKEILQQDKEIIGVSDENNKQ